jgi:hypothetical protein
MNLADYQNITNNFQDMHLVSMRNWKEAATVQPQDNGGPYLVAQEGLDPEDPALAPDEFLLGRRGQWLATKFFFRMPVTERRAEFVFGTAAEVMNLVQGLPSKPVVMRPPEGTAADTSIPSDEMLGIFRESRRPGPAENPS